VQAAVTYSLADLSMDSNHVQYIIECIPRWLNQRPDDEVSQRDCQSGRHKEMQFEVRADPFNAVQIVALLQMKLRQI